MFYSPEMLQTYTEEDLTMADLALSKDAITLMPGTRTSIEVICTAVSGLQTNVASACRYEVANPHVATIDGGVIRALEDGSTTATISYTDAMGNNRQLDFRLTVTTFPLTADAFNPSIYSTGKYNEKTLVAHHGPVWFRRLGVSWRPRPLSTQVPRGETQGKSLLRPVVPPVRRE